jgi:hypothetical protein
VNNFIRVTLENGPQGNKAVMEDKDLTAKEA